MIAVTVLLALVAGLPWALWHYIGWPLPDHVPRWVEIQGVLLGPMTTTFLLDFLACLCWIAWAAFTVDIARCALDAARGVRLPESSASGPVHALAAVLVGAVVLSVLGTRSASDSAPARSTALGTGSVVVATAPAWPHGGEVPGVRNAVFTTQKPHGGSALVGSPAHPVSVVVRAPENGVHDSLWRIAERTLGDGTRWPEIFELNTGKPQPGDRVLTQPSLIFPGEELLLPADAGLRDSSPQSPAQLPTTAPSPTTTAPPTSPPATPSAQPSSPATPMQQAPPTGTNATAEPGVRWGTGLFVGLGLATAVSVALMVARRRYRSRYRPGSGDRDDFPVAPVVYQLRLAHLRAEQDHETDLDDKTEDCARGVRIPPAPPLVIGEPETDASSSPTPGLGVRDGREIALNLARARGLGLVGAGAPAAVRALLLAILAASPPTGTTVVVPAPDVAALLGHAATRVHLPAALRVVDSLEEALDALEAEILVRAAARHEQATAPQRWSALALVAQPPRHQWQRLQAVLDNGAPFGITGLLLGQWQPGVSAYVRADGAISATSPGLGEALRGTEVFRLADDDTAELLTLLHQADSSADAEPAEHADRTPADAALDVITTAEAPADQDTALEILSPQPPPAPRPRARTTLCEIESSAPAAALGDTATQPPGPSEANAAPPAQPTTAPIRISVLGPPRVFWRPKPHTTGTESTEREITRAFQPRTRELLVFLALHPDGVSREALVGALWADTSSGKTTNALNTALSRLRGAVSKVTRGALPDITIVGDGRYRLDPNLVEADYWHFEAAVAARRAAMTERQRIDAYRRVVDTYGGPLADGMSAEWIEPAREAIRRDAIDAVAALARALVDSDPQQTLDLLEIARAFDPHNEAVYRDIMRLQQRLGQIDAIPRTLTLLTTRLAEIDTRPTEQAISLAARLRHRHTSASAREGPGRSAVG